MTTDTTERGLERLICTALTGHACDPPQAGAVRERPATYGVGCGSCAEADYRGHSETRCGRYGLPERQEELRQAERPDRT